MSDTSNPALAEPTNDPYILDPKISSSRQKHLVLVCVILALEW